MKRNGYISLAVFVIVAGVMIVGTPAAADPVTVSVNPVKDNTLIETPDGSLSLGAASSFYAGRVGPGGGGTIRRGVVAFDVASAVPQGAAVTEATLALYMSMTIVGPHTVVLKRMLADWGEGTSSAFGGAGDPSTPGDATWLHRFWPDVFWSAVGGDFSGVVSAGTVVDQIGWYTWETTPRLVADVQAWLDHPATNFGWLVQGNESVIHTVKQFRSREASPQFRPTLTITYSLPQCAPADLDCNGVVDVFDLLALLAAWGPCADCAPGNCPADLDGNCEVNVFDLLTLLANWG